MPSAPHTVWHVCPAGHVPLLQKNTPASAHAGGGPTQEQPLGSLWHTWPPGQAPFGEQVVWAHSGMVVVVHWLSGLVVDVVVVAIGGQGFGEQVPDPWAIPP